MVKSNVPGRNRSGYLPTLDGWRAISILAVMCVHAPLLQLGPVNDRWLYEQGGFGVQIFFAISGYLICTRLLEEESKTGTVDLRGFYIRRVMRIQPAALTYLATVLLLKIISVVVLSWGGFFAALFLVRNYLPVNAINEIDFSTGHFWTLSVEEHFYLLLPAFLLFVRHWRIRILLTVTAVLYGWNRYCIKHDLLGPHAYHRTDLCLPVLLLPAAIAIGLRRHAFRSVCERYLPPWLALFLAACIMVPIWSNWHHAIPATAVLAPCLAVLSTMLHPESLTGRLLECRPLRFIGRISFGLYLWQQLFVAGHVVPPNPAFGWFGRFPGSFVATFALAIASYYLIELTCMRLGHRLARPVVAGRPELEKA